MENKSEKIKERESRVKIGVIIFFSLVIGIPLFWHLISGNFKIDLSNLHLESILTLLVSFFAILLSILFYFKASDSSNQFYNNSYTFTKDISETLRGIEAGFGEKLQSIDKGYDDFRRSFEHYMSPSEKVEIKKEVEEEKKKLKEIIEEKDKLISELEIKSNMSKHELNNYLKQIKEKEIELHDKNEQINIIKSHLLNRENVANMEGLSRKLAEFIAIKILPDLNNDIISSRLLLPRYFKKMSENLPKGFIEDMKVLEYLNENGDLTRQGIDFIRKIGRK
jgi:hypothetical protein